MCGIAGIINFNGKPVCSDDLRKMSDALIHRGPDGSGFFCKDNVGIVHRRLAIIDPNLGAQPFYNDDRSIVLSYNGEVYNYVELRRELAGDFVFRTNSDTEVILRSYEKWEMACLERFRGMFAFALYDRKKDMLYLCRDRVGIKPLFYYHTNDHLVFASEIAPILQLDFVKREIEPGSVSGFFRYQYVPTPATIYKDLYKLEPGFYLETDIKKKKVIKRRYWDIKIDISKQSEPKWLELLNETLDDVMRIYMRSDVPFGAFLSGGTDSSLIVALMKKHLNEMPRTFTIGFNEDIHSELPFAAEASKTIGTEHYEKVVTPDLAEDILRTLAVHFGEPFADSSAIPSYYVAREASGKVKMVLSGDGGDELFAGYNSYQTTFRDYNMTPHKQLAGLFGFVFGGIGYYKPKYNAQRQAFNDAELRQLLCDDIPISPSVDFEIDAAIGAIDPVTFFQAQDFKTYLVDDVLTKVDRMSMANSLEVRVPLLDHKIIELAFSLPLSLKIRLDKHRNKLQTKYILKKSASRFYPESFLERPKQGFGIPTVEWNTGPLRILIERELGDKKNPIFNWLKFDHVQAMMNEFFNGRDSLVTKIWFIFMFSLWQKHVQQVH